MSQIAEDTEAIFDLRAREGEESLGAEALDGERAHHAAVKHRALKDRGREFGLGGEIAHEAARKGVASARGIVNLCDGQRRRAEGMRSVAEEDCRSVFAMLDDQRSRAHGED